MSSISQPSPSDALGGGGGLLDRLTDRTPNSTISRPRRLSDPSASGVASSAASRPLAVRSMDGSRWLPTPDEQSHRVGFGKRHEAVRTQPIAPELPRHICDAAVCSVAKAFETTELLESILCLLDTSDVLSLRRTSKQWNSTVQSSPYLRLHFFTHPQWERPPSEFQLLPLNLPGVSIEKDEPIHLGQWIKVTLTSKAAKRICPEPKQPVRSRSIFEGLRGGLGRSSNDAWPNSPATPALEGVLKYENLHISQPPILGMQAYLIHQASTMTDSGPAAISLAGTGTTPRNDAPAIAKLSCDTGITLGFLAETAQDLMASQTSGPSDAGDMKVVFKAIISFCEKSDATPKRSTGRNLRTVMRIG